ncbi:MAG: amidohydrolase [Candidatus Dormibacteraeota bacterium]|nr:amidohydrolase [Candidatus Dormibacteraeota bacterium]
MRPLWICSSWSRRSKTSPGCVPTGRLSHRARVGRELPCPPVGVCRIAGERPHRIPLPGHNQQVKIDAYCHIMPRAYADRLAELVATPASANIRARVAGVPSMVDLDLRFRQMDEFGPDYRQIVSIPAPPAEDLGPPAVSREFARLGNEGMAELVLRHPDRFAGFVACLPMNDPEAAVEELDHACAQLGALGGQIYTHVNGHPMDEARFEPLYAWAAQAGKMLWVHPSRDSSWADYPTEERSKYELWWVFGWEYDTAIFMGRLVLSGVLERHPALKVLIHHGGSMVPHFAGRVGPGLDQLGARTPPERRADVEHPPLSKRPIDYFRMFYVDTAMFGARHAIRCSLDFFGVDRTLFASDSPFDPEKGPGYIRATIADLEGLDLTPEERNAIYEGNARRLLGLDRVTA